MTYFEEEEIYEPTEADVVLQEYKEKMKAILVESAKNEMNRMRERIAVLENEVRSNADEIYRLQAIERAIDRFKERALSDARKMRLGEVLESLKVIRWKVRQEMHHYPKCDQCDDERRISFTSPSGKTVYEACQCAVGFWIWQVRAFEATEFRLDDNKKHGLPAAVWYIMKRDNNVDYGELPSSYLAKEIYDGRNFKDIKDPQKMYFDELEQCQTYCNWLNENSKA